MPIQHFTANRELLYAGIDEVLAKPPSKIVRYGNAILLSIIVIIFSIAFFVRYKEGVNTQVMIRAADAAMIRSGNESTIIKNIRVQSGMAVKKGDTIMVLSTTTTTYTIISPIGGKLRKQRILAEGDLVNPSTDLFLVENEPAKYTVTIMIPKKEVQKISIGQSLKITLDKFPREKYGQLTATVISLPYASPDVDNYIADAVLSGETGKITQFYQEPGTAFITTGNKRLFAKFLDL